MIVAMLVSGCVYLPRTVKLVQPEPGRPSPICIEVEPFSDARADKTRIGIARNGFYWPEGTAHTDDDVAQWIATHLRASLAPGACVPELLLRGRIRDVFVDEYFNLSARLVVSLRLERAQTVVFDREFEGNFSQLSHLGSSAEFDDTLRKALAEFGERTIPAIIAAAAQPPLPPGL